MRHPVKLQDRRNQKGIVLVVLAIILALTASVYYFKAISVTEVKLENIQQTRQALNTAKKALIEYAVMHGETDTINGAIGSGDPGQYGYLPCPYISADNADYSDDAIQEGTCGSTHLNSIGMLPWKSLETGLLRDGDGNCLWYVVSGGYKNNPSSGLINEDTSGAIAAVDENNNIVVGNTPDDRVIALVIAPGRPINGQVRPYISDKNLACGHDGSDPADYLEGNGVTDNSTLQGIAYETDAFIHADLKSEKLDNDDVSATNYNDQFIAITRDDIWQAAQNVVRPNLEKLTEALALCLQNYATQASNTREQLPWPAPVDLSGDYRSDAEYDDVANAALGYAGRFPLVVDDSNTVTGVSGFSSFLDAGSVCGSINVYGETANFTDPGNKYSVLLDNWKDHIFYVLSKDYQPDSGTIPNCSSGNCIQVNGIKVAATVIFSGMRNGQSRYYDDLAMSPDVPDHKNDVADYIEVNDGNFPDSNGDKSYQKNPGNDYMICLSATNPPVSVPC